MIVVMVIMMMMLLMMPMMIVTKLMAVMMMMIMTTIMMTLKHMDLSPTMQNVAPSIAAPMSASNGSNRLILKQSGYDDGFAKKGRAEAMRRSTGNLVPVQRRLRPWPRLGRRRFPGTHPWARTSRTAPQHVLRGLLEVVDGFLLRGAQVVL